MHTVADPAPIQDPATLDAAADFMAPLMEREDPTSTDLADAHHWTVIYDQLIHFKHRLIERAVTEFDLLADEAKAGVAGDLELLRGELARFESRRQFWIDRQHELRGFHLDAEARTVSIGGVSVHLTRREFQLVEALARHAGQSLLPARLIAEAWHDPALRPEQLRLYIACVRAKTAHLAAFAIRHTPARGYSLAFIVAAVEEVL